MKVFANPPFKDFAMSRIAGALKRYALPGLEFVDDEDDADLIILYAHGFKKQIWYSVGRQIAKKRQSAIIQISLKSTPNPTPKDWIRAWQNTNLVWSYYDLPKICADGGIRANFNFYHAPLGVDAEVFQEDHKQDRKYIAGVNSVGWSRESLAQVVTAARAVGEKVLNIGKKKALGDSIDYTGIVNDATLARFYSQCKYVSGLRRVEGFEMPVIEGLMCGARPICFDLDCYRIWFDELAEFIPENGSANIIPSLIELFKKEPRPVSNKEKRLVQDKFSWEKIIQGFWAKL